MRASRASLQRSGERQIVASSVSNPAKHNKTKLNQTNKSALGSSRKATEIPEAFSAETFPVKAVIMSKAETGKVYTSREAAELGGEILEVEEKPGVFRKALPVLPLFVAIPLAILSIVPGLGTLIAAFLSLCFPHASGSKCKGFFVNIAAALLQVITAPIMVGWIWSCIWGMTMIQLARKEPTS